MQQAWSCVFPSGFAGNGFGGGDGAGLGQVIFLIPLYALSVGWPVYPNLFLLMFLSALHTNSVLFYFCFFWTSEYQRACLFFFLGKYLIFWSFSFFLFRRSGSAHSVGSATLQHVLFPIYSIFVEHICYSPLSTSIYMSRQLPSDCDLIVAVTSTPTRFVAPLARKLLRDRLLGPQWITFS